ncbi:glycoside hydrolase family 5 protein [Adhaeribacter aquaticus]|uniref:glycoside hydrolase family 5 protein n=1 Tax=Adhaeribacter aquaticus TaxID=299567 RepID=UPI00054FE370|nr:glycoside hydrolase family 5 protein [Adhaeribacter aquaticus]
MKSFLSKSLLACALLFGSISAYAQNAAGPVSNKLSQVRVQGNKFVTADGKTIIFRGLDTSDPEKLQRDGHWNKEYFEQMKIWGANIVRFPVHPTAWRKLGEAEYVKLMDQGVQWATDLGMYVIIDWHSIGNLRTQMYQSPNYETTQKETFEFWRSMAKHYKDNTTVALFEIFNEPTVQGGQLGTCSWSQWKELNEEIIGIIRANGAKAVPLVAGFNWAYDLTPVANDPIKAEGIAYVSHPYPQKREKPWEPKWMEDWGFVAKKYPVILTEIGFSGENERGKHVPVISDESYGEAITKFADANGISYTVWVFDPQWAPMLFTDWNYTPTRQGKYFKAALQKAAKK